jgi:splicing factor 3A subunit 1
MHVRQQEENGAMDMEMEASDDEEDERQKEYARKRQAQEAAKPGQGQMKIRSDYVPRALAKRQQGLMGICPNCGQNIALEEMEEHMRSMSRVIILVGWIEY